MAEIRYNNGDAVFIFTPKPYGVKLAREMFERGQNDATGRWASWHFTSLDNPHISVEALGDITQDMTWSMADKLSSTSTVSRPAIPSRSSAA